MYTMSYMGGMEDLNKVSKDHKPEDFKHIEGQEGRVKTEEGWLTRKLGMDSDKEKAEQMARTENTYQSAGKLYAEYLSVPDANRDEWARIHLPENKTAQSEKLGKLKELENLGVTPEYLKKLGEVMAEVTGANFDWKEKIQSMKPNELQKAVQELQEQMNTPAFKELVGKIGKGAIEAQTPEQINALTQVKLAQDKNFMTQMEMSKRGISSDLNSDTVGNAAALGEAVQVINLLSQIFGR